MAAVLSITEKEVWQTLKPATLCLKFIGISLDDSQNPVVGRFLKVFSFCTLSYILFCLFANLIIVSLDTSTTSLVVGFASCLHFIGYGVMSK